ncbi:MAG: hypothetical protein MI919_03255, partial [Holophagales bacterium]|nr:hypothetical protein [Holophagales bacterium]
LHRLLGNLDQAEKQLTQGLRIIEPLDHPEIWKDYGELAKVAEARGDAKAAADWTAKRDAKLTELRKLEGGSAGLPEEAAKAFLGLARAVYAVRTSGEEVPPDMAELLAHLDSQGEPLASAGAFLRSVVEGGSPTVPPGLPEPLPQIFAGLLESLGASH